MGLTKPWHWAVLLLVVLLLFGAKRLPDLAKSVGQSMKIFKKEIKELHDDEPPVTPIVVPEATATAPPVVVKPTTAPSESSAPPKA